MNRTIRIAGLLLASLTISTVALAQQGGGGGRGGGDGGGSGASGGRGGEGGGGGDSGVIEFLLKETERARLTRAVERRLASPKDCLTHVCNEPPPPPPPRRRPRGDGQPEIQRTFDHCGGGDTVLVYRGAAGQIVRYACDVRR